jgi:hypothetical protein
VFRSLFSKNKAVLTGAPAVRRMKTYSAQSGFVYQYYYEGHRAAGSGEGSGTEFVFTISADRKTWHQTGVLLRDAAIHSWQKSHGRDLSSTERYAIAKMALFQAFDERPDPASMQEEVLVRNADVEAIVDTLDL